MDVKDYLNPAEEKMELAVAYLDESLSHIRAGKASAKLIDGIRVEYYGSVVPISNVANVSVPDARTIAITPWEKGMFKEIEKAILNSELGITPENNGEVIRLCIPPLTEERRKVLVKQSKAEAENAPTGFRHQSNRTRRPPPMETAAAPRSSQAPTRAKAAWGSAAFALDERRNEESSLGTLRTLLTILFIVKNNLRCD